MSARRWLRTWLPTILMVLLVAVFVRLAVWQYDRAQVRENHQAAVAAAVKAPATRLVPAGVDRLADFAHVYVEGHYLDRRQILLKEMPQPVTGEVGYVVLTPFMLPSRRLVLVERGWIAMNADGAPRADLAAPPGRVRVSGYLAALPNPGLRLGSNPPERGWPKHMLYPDWSELDRLYGPALVHGVILLGAGEGGGYARSWHLRLEHGPQENYGYMAQWAGLAATVFVVWLLLFLRRVRRNRAR